MRIHEIEQITGRGPSLPIDLYSLEVVKRTHDFIGWFPLADP
jgi:hypothetical protein